MPNKRFKFLFLIFFLLILSGCGLNNVNNSTESGDESSENIEKAETVSGKIIINSGQESFSDDFSIEKGLSVFDLMKRKEENGTISIQYDESSAGVFIKSINSVENNNEKNEYWMMYVNDNLANVGASDYVIADNDIIEWRYVDTSNMSF